MSDIDEVDLGLVWSGAVICGAVAHHAEAGAVVIGLSAAGGLVLGAVTSFALNKLKAATQKHRDYIAEQYSKISTGHFFDKYTGTAPNGVTSYDQGDLRGIFAPAMWGLFASSMAVNGAYSDSTAIQVLSIGIPTGATALVYGLIKFGDMLGGGAINSDEARARKIARTSCIAGAALGAVATFAYNANDRSESKEVSLEPSTNYVEIIQEPEAKIS